MSSRMIKTPLTAVAAAYRTSATVGIRHITKAGTTRTAMAGHRTVESPHIARMCPKGMHGAHAGVGVRWLSGANGEKNAEEKPKEEGSKEAEGASAAGEEKKPKDPLEEKDEIIKQKDEEIKTLKHKMLSAMADVENMRTRMANKAEEDRKFAVRSFAKNMLEVADVLDKALESVPEEKRKANPDLQAIYEGVEMTNRLFLKGLEAQNIKKFDPTGDKFDANLHQAVFNIPVEEGGEKGIVKTCVKVGYVIHDRCLRPAEVGVTK